MEGAAEAAGLATTATLASQAHARPGAPAAAADHPAHCLNCGAVLSGAFCHMCGQKAHLHRSIGHIFEELVHGVLHWDSKGWRTLPLLVANPGRLTREYVQGRRARYIAPLSLFLALFLITFIMLGSFGPSLDTAVEIDPADRQQAIAEARAELERARAEGAPAAVLKPIEERLAAAGSGGPGTASEPQLHRGMRGLSKELEVVTPGGTNAGLTRKARKALSQPELTIYKIKQKAYKLSFLLIPMSVPFVWLLFASRRDLHLYDHTVFVLYSLSFMCMLVLALVAVAHIGGGRVEGLVDATLLIVPVLHIFAQLRGAYQLTAGAAAWRTALLSVSALGVAGAYLLLMLLLGLLD